MSDYQEFLRSKQRVVTAAGFEVSESAINPSSEGYQALKQGRKFIGIELKESYWRLAQKHLAQAELLAAQPDLFSWAQAQGE